MDNDSPTSTTSTTSSTTPDEDGPRPERRKIVPASQRKRKPRTVKNAYISIADVSEEKGPDFSLWIAASKLKLKERERKLLVIRFKEILRIVHLRTVKEIVPASFLETCLLDLCSLIDDWNGVRISKLSSNSESTSCFKNYFSVSKNWWDQRKKDVYGQVFWCGVFKFVQQFYERESTDLELQRRNIYQTLRDLLDGRVQYANTKEQPLLPIGIIKTSQMVKRYFRNLDLRLDVDKWIQSDFTGQSASRTRASDGILIMSRLQAELDSLLQLNDCRNPAASSTLLPVAPPSLPSIQMLQPGLSTPALCRMPPLDMKVQPAPIPLTAAGRQQKAHNVPTLGLPPFAPPMRRPLELPWNITKPMTPCPSTSSLNSAVTTLSPRGDANYVLPPQLPFVTVPEPPSLGHNVCNLLPIQSVPPTQMMNLRPVGGPPMGGQQPVNLILVVCGPNHGNQAVNGGGGPNQLTPNQLSNHMLKPGPIHMTRDMAGSGVYGGQHSPPAKYMSVNSRFSPMRAVPTSSPSSFPF